MGIITSGVNALSKSRLIESQNKTNLRDPNKFLVMSAVISAMAKDAVGCYYYTTQSLNNERIPEDKRKFVASLDLMNGGLMILTQFIMALFVDSKTEGLYNKRFGKYFKDLIKDDKVIKENVERLTKTEQFKNLTPENFKKYINGLDKVSKAGFRLVAAVGAATILGKRIITPLIATPMATWFNKNYINKLMPQKEGSKVATTSQNNTTVPEPVKNTFITQPGTKNIFELYEKTKA